MAHLKTFNFTVELAEGGDHVLHRILRPAPPQPVNGVNYPASFQPLQDITTIEDFQRIELAFESANAEVRDFWMPLFRPKGGENDLVDFLGTHAEDATHSAEYHNPRDARLWTHF